MKTRLNNRVVRDDHSSTIVKNGWKIKKIIQFCFTEKNLDVIAKMFDYGDDLLYGRIRSNRVGRQ